MIQADKKSWLKTRRDNNIRQNNKKNNAMSSLPLKSNSHRNNLCSLMRWSSTGKSRQYSKYKLWLQLMSTSQQDRSRQLSYLLMMCNNHLGI